MFNRVGGLKEDLPAGWNGRVRAAVAALRERLRTFDDLVLGNEIFRARTRGVGVLAPEHVHAYGVSGPIARASGVDFDLRRDEPYLAYGELGDVLRVVTRQEGDCLARFECLLDQTRNSLDLADACLDRLADAADRADQPAAAEGAQGSGGRHLRLDREPARRQRLLPGVARRQDPVAAQAALGLVQQHPGAGRAAARDTWSPTWWRSSARCSSWSATSTSSRSAARRRRGRGILESPGPAVFRFSAPGYSARSTRTSIGSVSSSAVRSTRPPSAVGCWCGSTAVAAASAARSWAACGAGSPTSTGRPAAAS